MYSTRDYGAFSFKKKIATLKTEGKMQSCCHQLTVFRGFHLSHLAPFIQCLDLRSGHFQFWI